VELVDRVRAIPLFEFVSVDGMFRVAAVGEEIRHSADRELFRAGAAAPYVEFLLDGRVAGDAAVVAAPAVLGLHEVLEGGPATSTIRASGPLVCLRIAAPDLLTVLSDDMQLAQGLFRMLLAPAEGERIVAEGFVVKPGRTLCITRGEVHALRGDKRKLVAVMQQTLMVMHGKEDE